MNEKVVKCKEIARLAIPVLISEFLEEALIVTDSILLSYKPSIFLAAVGIIDAILLIVLSYGIALNDSYQNYFARHCHTNLHNVITVFKNGCKSFFLSGSLISITGILLSLILIRVVDNNDIIACVGKSVWFLLPLGILTYISMWLNSFLMGLGHYKLLALTSSVCVVINGVLGYTLLFEVSLNITPTAIVLITSSMAEFVAIVIMGTYILIKYSPNDVSETFNHQRLLTRTFYTASVYPAISEIGFHLGSLLLFLLSSFFLPQSQVALLTLIFSYWGLMQVPVDGLQEISLNIFANIHSKKKSEFFSSYSNNLIKFSRVCCIVLFIIVLIADLFFEDRSIIRLTGIIIVFIISLSACGTEIFNTSLIVRLKNDSYIVSKIIFGGISCVLILTGRFIFGIENIFVILIPFLFAQIGENWYSTHKAKSIWNYDS